MIKVHFCTLVLTVVLCSSAFAQKEKAGETSETVPVSYGIVVDNSGSFRVLVDKVIKIVKDVAEENRGNDETFLVTFVDSDKIRLLQDFTGSKEAINDATDEMFIEGGRTAVIDAVYFSAKHFAGNAQKGAGRSRALLLVTDGDERESITKLELVLDYLKTENIRLYVIGIADGKVYTRLLDRLAKETGGRVYLPRTTAEVTAAIKEFSAAVRSKTVAGR